LERFRDTSQLTDDHGDVALPVEIFVVRGGLSVLKMKLKDQVTGNEYQIRIQEGEWEEILNVLMVPNMTVQGRHFSVTVLGIGPPVPRGPT
jgi:hypothetical protein